MYNLVFVDLKDDFFFNILLNILKKKSLAY